MNPVDLQRRLLALESAAARTNRVVARPGGGGGGISIEHYDTFPTITHTGEKIIEVGGFLWNAYDTDIRWHLMNFEFTTLSGDPGTGP